MIGFRPGLGTQDAMLLIKREILDRKTKDVLGILALDLTKAIGTVLHKHVLKKSQL